VAGSERGRGAEVRAGCGWNVRRDAADLDLIVTGSSDHHSRDKVDHELASNTSAHDQLDRLLDAAR